MVAPLGERGCLSFSEADQRLLGFPWIRSGDWLSWEPVEEVSRYMGTTVLFKPTTVPPLEQELGSVPPKPQGSV